MHTQNDTIASTEPLWAEGPNLQHITNEDGTYWVNPEWRERYLTKAASLSKNMDRLVAAHNLHPQTSAALSIRNRARAIHGARPVDDVRDPNRYWPSDSIGLAGTLLHFEILDELASEDQAAELDALTATYIPRCGACETLTRLLGDLCEDCHAALRFVQHQNDEAKANEPLEGGTGRTRGQAVIHWLRS